MPSFTPNYDFALPFVNSSTDQDLWGGYLNGNFSSLDTILQTIQNASYPVGSVYINMTNSTNPATLLGFGTWTAITGVAIVGAGTGTDSNGNTQTFTAGTQVGEYKHTLTVTEMPSHTHADSGHAHTAGSGEFLTVGFGSPASVGSGVGITANPATATSYAVIQSTGGGAAHNNVMPVIGAYVWERTA